MKYLVLFLIIATGLVNDQINRPFDVRFKGKIFSVEKAQSMEKDSIFILSIYIDGSLGLTMMHNMEKNEAFLEFIDAGDSIFIEKSLKRAQIKKIDEEVDTTTKKIFIIE